LTPTGATVALGQRAGGAAVEIRYAGARASAQIVGEQALPGKVHYVVGRDPRHWRSDVPTYGRVRYRGLYPGIDLVYYGTARGFEYDLVVAPGADPAIVAFEIAGARSVDLDALGDLVVRVPGGELRQRRPAIYQEVGGVRRPVAGGFVAHGARRIGFRVGAYDVTRPLVIDPQVAYATYLAGTGGDFGYGIAVDAARNAYITGETSSAAFPTTAGALDTARGGATDAFITKLNASGSALVYSTYLGGSGTETGYAVAVDGAGNAYVTGQTASMDFPTTAGAFDTTGDGNDGFVVKLNPAGSALVYGTYLGGSAVGTETGRGIAVDASGAAFVAGVTPSMDFPATMGALDTTFNGGLDAFLVKLNNTGTTLVYGTFLGGTATDLARGVAVDASGNAYLTGQTLSSNFMTTMGAFDTSANGLSDAFVAKVNSTGASLVYSTYLGGSNADLGVAIAVDAAGGAHVTGQTLSANFPTTMGAYDTTANGSHDVFVTRVDPSGASLAFSTYLGGSATDDEMQLGGIAVDPGGHVYVTGDTLSSNFPTTPGAPDTGCGTDGTCNSGLADAFVAKFSPGGATLLFSTYLGGSAQDRGFAIAIDRWSSIYLTGTTRSIDFPATPGAFDTFASGLDDGIVARYTPVTTVGVYEPAASRFYLRNSNSGGPADVAVVYGPAGLNWTPLVGDWDGDGVDTVGMYNPATGTFYLRNSNTLGAADLTFQFGPPGLGWVSIVGDWNGDGTDTVGLYDPATATFYLRNTNAAGAADVAFNYGPPGLGWIPLAGDWDGSGTDTVGLYDPATSVFFLRNANAAGPADLAFGYGPPAAGWTPLAGDWNGDTIETVGLYQPSAGTFYLRNTNNGGSANLAFPYGPGGLNWTALAGDWDGL
jgi:hypothetical protein